MADLIRMRVLTDAGVAFEDSAVSIIAPGKEGYFGILCNHAPLLAALAPGKLSWRLPNGQGKTMRIGEGFLEVVKNQVTLLTSRLEPQPAVGNHQAAAH